MPLLLLNAGNDQGLLPVMHVGIKDCGVVGSAIMCAANMGGKDHETSSGVMYAQKLRYSSLMLMQERKSGNTTS
jgi:hypothetical protein